MEEIARNCEGFSGAALAGVARAAASHALERAVNEFSRFQEVNGSETAGEGSAAPSIMDCIVTFDDFDEAVADVSASMGNSDYADESDADEEKADGSTGDDSEEPVSPE